MEPNVIPLLKEARNRLARAERCFEQVYQSQSEFSLAAERVRELLQETRSWLEDYSEEVRDVGGTAGEDRPAGIPASGGS